MHTTFFLSKYDFSLWLWFLTFRWSGPILGSFYKLVPIMKNLEFSKGNVICCCVMTKTFSTLSMSYSMHGRTSNIIQLFCQFNLKLYCQKCKELDLSMQNWTKKRLLFSWKITAASLRKLGTFFFELSTYVVVNFHYQFQFPFLK